MKRNGLLDLLKLLCAYMVVVVHLAPPGEAGVFIDSMCRMSLAPFFLISGYFFRNGAGIAVPQAVKKRVRKLCRMLIGWMIFYLAASTILIELGRGHFADVPSRRTWLNLVASPRSIVRFFVLQEVPGLGYALWFLQALIYCELLALLLDRKGCTKLGYALILPLLATQLGLEWARNRFSLSLAGSLTNNAWIMGIPMFFLGDWIRTHESRTAKLPSAALIALALAGLILPYFECLAFGPFDLFLGNHVAAVALFLLALRFGEGVRAGDAIHRMQSASVLVYLLHPLFAKLLLMAQEKLPALTGSIEWLSAPMVFFVSLVVGLTGRRLIARLRARA